MRHLSRKVVLVVALVAAGMSPLAAQAPAQKPSFEVASIKRSDPDQRGATTQFFVGGRLVSKGTPLRTLIAVAYGVRTFQILGGLSWIGTDRWDIEARAEEGSIPPKDQANVNAADAMALRLQSLLEDRFQLKIHRDTRELPVYELTIAKSGLKMKLSDDQTPFQLPERGTPPPPDRGDGIGRYQLRFGRGNVEGVAVEIGPFVQSLSYVVGRTIVDKTGLTGLYDIKLQWMPDMPAANSSIGSNGPEVASAIDPNAPSIFTAIQEQLGLRLESAKGPVEVLVIDSVQRPSDN